MEQHRVKIEGQVIDDWIWVNVPDMVNIIVHEDASNEWLLFQQTKYGLVCRMAAVLHQSGDMWNAEKLHSKPHTGRCLRSLASK
jgi:hypothetical protein